MTTKEAETTFNPGVAMRPVLLAFAEALKAVTRKQRLTLLLSLRAFAQDEMLNRQIRREADEEEDEGQNLVEYALVVALICFASIATMRTLALNINSAFANIDAALVGNT